MRRVAPIAAIVVLCAGSGCVQQDKYNDTVLSNRTLKEQLVAAERGYFFRRPGIGVAPSLSAAYILSSLEERAIWARFGL